MRPSHSIGRIIDASTSSAFKIYPRPTPAWACKRCCSGLQEQQRDQQSRQLSTLTRPRNLPSTHFTRLPVVQSDVVASQHRATSSSAKNGQTTTRGDLPSQREGRRSHIAKRFSHVMDHLQSNIFIAGQRLNDLTGYSGIEALKKDIQEQEQLVQTTRKALQAAREAYSMAISQRSGSQREVNELLQRKHAWTPNDLERFTALYRSDHANEQAETAAQDNLVAVERRAEQATAKLSASILARYHEEQIWSDKIRRMSTWGTWGLMGVNILLFLVFQIGVEPWRRRRLVKGFEEKVMEALGREGTSSGPASTLHQATEYSSEVHPIVNEQSITLEKTGPEVVPLVNEVNLSENAVSALGPNDEMVSALKASGTALDKTEDFVRDLFSHRELVISRVQLTAIALEGAAAGAILATALLMLLKPR